MASAASAASAARPDFTGKWQLDRSEGFDDYLKAIRFLCFDIHANLSVCHSSAPSISPHGCVETFSLSRISIIFTKDTHELNSVQMDDINAVHH